MPATGRLRRNILALYILQFLNYAVPLITVPYLARVLGPERFGLVAFAQAVIIYFDLITDYGFNLSATRKVAACRGNRTLLSRVFWSTLATKLLLMSACALALGFVVRVVPAFRGHTLLYAAAFLTVAGTACFPTWLFQGLEQMRFLTIGYASARILSIPVLFLAVRHSDDYVLAAAIQGAVPLVAALIVAPVVWKRVGVDFYRPSASEILVCLREGWHLFLSNTGMYLYSSTAVVLLGLIAGNAQVGYYSASDKLIKAAGALINPLTQALYPHLNSLRASHGDSVMPLIRRMLLWVGAFTLTASIGVMIVARPLGHLLFGTGFEPSVTVLRCMAPLLFLLGINNILSTQTMMVFGLDRVASRIILTSAVATGFFTLWFARTWGAPGAALATVAGAFLMTLQMVAALKRAQLAVWREQKEPSYAA